MNVFRILADMTVRVEEGKLYITTDKESLGALHDAFEGMFRLARILKMKAVTARGELEEKLRAEEARLRPVREAEYRKLAFKAFDLYTRHLNNGCAGDKAKARRATAADLGMRCVDVKYLLQHYRLISKAEDKEGAVCKAG